MRLIFFAAFNFLLALANILLSCPLPANAYYFRGYHVPVVIVSPMKDDAVYTPAGKGLITSLPGFRIHPVTGRASFHTGVDLAASLNDPVYNLMDGVVTRVGYRGNLGVAVEVYHPYPRITTIVGHLNAYSVQPGDIVERGRLIGYAGSTGRSTGVHVHYTVKMHDSGQYVDPIAYLRMVPRYVAALKGSRTTAALRDKTRAKAV